MKKMCIIPFLNEIIPVIMCPPDDYKISNVVAMQPFYWGETVSHITNRSHSGIIMTGDMNEGIQDSDLVVICDIGSKQRILNNKAYNPYREFSHKAILAALKCKKDIVCFMPLNDQEYTVYMRLAEDAGVCFTCQSNTVLTEESLIKHEKLNIPVVCIGEMIPGCDGYEIFLKLLKRLKKDSFHVVGISEDIYNLLYRQITLSFFNRRDMESNIKALSKFVYEIQNESAPDLIVVKLPTPMTAYDDTITFDFGTMAYMLMQTFKPDYFIYCGLSGYWQSEFIENIESNFQYRFGSSISVFHFCNQLLDQTTEIKEKMSTIRIPDIQVAEEIEKVRQHVNYPVYNLLDAGDFERFYSDLKYQIFGLTFGVI